MESILLVINGAREIQSNGSISVTVELFRCSAEMFSNCCCFRCFTLFYRASYVQKHPNYTVNVTSDHISKAHVLAPKSRQLAASTTFVNSFFVHAEFEPLDLVRLFKSRLKSVL